MSAQPYESTPTGRDGLHSAAQVRAALPPEQTAEFDAAWNAALDEARTTLDLAQPLQVIRDFRAIASALASTHADQARQDAQRWRDGKEIDSIPAHQVLDGLG